MSNVETILESIEKLTLLEAAELVKAMEEKFGVSAAAPVAVAAAAPAAAAEGGAEEASEVTVVLAEAGAPSTVLETVSLPVDALSNTGAVFRAAPLIRPAFSVLYHLGVAVRLLPSALASTRTSRR